MYAFKKWKFWCAILQEHVSLRAHFFPPEHKQYKIAAMKKWALGLFQNIEMYDLIYLLTLLKSTQWEKNLLNQ